MPRSEVICVEILAGGVSNLVLKASWGHESIVLKQSLPVLRVAAEWEFDQARILVERDCLQTLGELVPGSVPQVVFADDAAFILAMTLAPPGGSVWREQLAAGIVSPETVRQAARLLAEIQRTSASQSALLRPRFADLMPLYEGRIDPFHREVARAHPDLRDPIHREIRRLSSTREVLVHGDYSPKNFIAYGDYVLLLDCEVAHWGDPAFDPAFLLCHLMLDVLSPSGAATIDSTAALLAWHEYRAAGGLADQQAVIAELGCLMLARVDGKSPLANIPARLHDGIRVYGAHLLKSAYRTVDAALTASAAYVG